MDPATILTLTISVSKVVYNCSLTLFQFIQDVSAADSTIGSLYSETETLRRTLESITNTLQSPSLQKYKKQSLWKDVEACLRECEKTGQTLSGKLEKIRPRHEGKRNVMKVSLEIFKLNFKDDEIKTLRAQMLSHSSAMQIILQMINVHISSTAPTVVLDELAPQLQTLVTLVTDLHKSALPPEVGGSALQRTRTGLETSAKEVASKASAVVSSRSTAWSGSQADLKSVIPDHIMVVGRRKLPPTTGSELGEPLTLEARNRISAWVSQDLRDDNTILSVPEESPSIFSEHIAGSSASRTTPEPTRPSNMASNEDTFESSDDEQEVEIEIARTYLLEARKRSQSNPAQAEEFLRKALSLFSAIRSTEGSVEIPRIQLEIAAACFDQDKLRESIALCDQLMRETPTDDESRERTLEASHLLSQLYFRQGLSDDALRQCKRTLNGRKRFKGKDTAYFRSVVLMSTIHEHRGDEIEALAYVRLLPAEFTIPEFKRPNPELAAIVCANKSDQQMQTPPSLLENINDSASTLSPITTPSTKRSEKPATFATAFSGEDAAVLQPAEYGEAIKLLEKEGLASNTKPDLVGYFLMAAQKGHLSVVRLLLTDWEYHKDSLHFLKLFARRTEPTYYRRVRVDDTIDARRRTALHFAAMAGHSKVVRILLDHGASQVRRHDEFGSYKDSFDRESGFTPLEYAVRRGHVDTLEEFLRKGLQKNAADLRGWTVLHHAASLGQVNSLTWLLDAGIDIQAKTNDGTTALHLAALSGSRDMIEILILKGAIVNAQAQNRSTPLSVAISSGHMHCASDLAKAGANEGIRNS